MANPAKMAGFTSSSSQKETQLDKTTRIVRRITEAETEARQLKMLHLRNARFDSEADEVKNAEPHKTTTGR